MAFIETEKVVRDFEWSMNELHSHRNYELYYLSSGQRRFFLTNDLISIQAPCFIVIPPEVLHKTDGGRYERYNVNVDEKYLTPFQSEVLKELSLKMIIPDENANKAFVELLEKLSSVSKNDKHYESKMNALFSYFILELSELKEEVSLGSEHQLSRSDSAAMRIIKYINENYREHITLDVLSRLFFASKPTIINQFNAITNSSPINYLLQVRINHAKQMLSNTNKSISEISEACGFSSPNYFSLIFKKKTHMSPSDYRNCYPKA
jgi:AraC-like DNA-binding protein